MEILDSIRKIGIKARGQRELIEYLNGKKLSLRQAVYAYCYSCMGYFADGRADCGVPDCPLYPFMLFRAGRKTEIKKPRTEKQIEASLKLAKRMSKHR